MSDRPEGTDAVESPDGVGGRRSVLQDALDRQSTGGRHAAGPARAAARTGQARARRATRTPPPPLSVGRQIVRGVGELLITVGLVLVLLVVYEVYVTDWFGARKQATATEQLDTRWERSGPAVVTVPGSGGSTVPGPSGSTTPVTPVTPGEQVDPATRTKRYDTTVGEGFAKIYVPSFGTDYVFTVIEGTNPDDLYIGPGHYEGSQYPGQPGNFAVAGHRVSKGSPFNDLDLVQACDSIVVETREDWFVYRVLPMQDEAATWDAAAHAHCTGVPKPAGAYAQVFGRTIVQPTDGAVVFPVPGSNSDAVPSDAERLITLTTCHPQFSDAERMIIHGTLVASYAKSSGFRPPELDDESE